MARGLILPSQCKTTSQLLLTSISRFSSKTNPFTPNRLICSCSPPNHVSIDISKYKETFSKRMAMAGLKSHHPIALGVSGGPDSMALCVLVANWKTDDLNATTKESSEFIDGILAIIVDHGLRAESKVEANMVCRRVLNMGIRCEIAGCEWLDGKPKQGHLQEAARSARYQNFQSVCTRHQIGVLLVAHHADDQAELFILRLSRNSGVLGLAGMAFTSQLFATCPNIDGEASSGILLVRPLLEFSKEDMYKICQGGNQEWVEDPTNQSPLFARNRIRMSLKNLSSSIFKSELQSIISACRRTRLYVDQFCHDLINQAVAIMPQGYAMIDLEILNPSKIEDIHLSKFVAMLLQFISQRQRPVRGSALKLLLDYIRTFPCKTSFTAAGCYLCAAPGSKGTKLLICCSVNSSLPSKMEMFHTNCYEDQNFDIPREVDQIVADVKSYSDKMVPDAHEIHFLDVTSSESVLIEAKKLNILSESTHRSILSLQVDEIEHFKSKTEIGSDHELNNGIESDGTSLSKTLYPGQVGYFMNRFVVSWRLGKNVPGDAYCCCRYCLVGHDVVAGVRHMVDADWLYLAEVSKCQNVERFLQQRVHSAMELEQGTEEVNSCSNYVSLSAQRALLSLKTIPVAARRGLPVLVNLEGLLLSIPSVGFDHCPCLTVFAEFKPRVPLGGGHSSFI